MYYCAFARAERFFVCGSGKTECCRGHDQAVHTARTSQSPLFVLLACGLALDNVALAIAYNRVND